MNHRSCSIFVMMINVPGKGSDPEWNDTFVFGVSDDVPELLIKIMDSDGPSGDDFVGEAKAAMKKRDLLHKKNKAVVAGKSLSY
ncbi:hypothetical protein BUALT_Bualt10G0043900 [Buddleja alternifolia]|uniref:C2 domain-containing protein n=1 Tax=Buddleja alternifolia TaxID=168488 RepID=A0AAV6X388_9LAMI|nr:hypothetical protein BUALT_Bualt10G0043900 [Buddleja alternifolia]